MADLCCHLGLFKISETLEISSGDDVRGIFPIFSLWWVTHDKSSTASPTFGLPWRYIYQRWTGQLGFKGKRRERAWPSTRLAVSPTIGHLNPTWRRREELPRKMDFKVISSGIFWVEMLTCPRTPIVSNDLIINKTAGLYRQSVTHRLAINRHLICHLSPRQMSDLFDSSVRSLLLPCQCVV